jgi:hypothetical protein
MSPPRRLNAHFGVLMLDLVFLALAFQPCSLASSAAKAASGWFSPHCDGASFYMSKVDGLLSGQKLIMTIRHYALSWWNYRPQEVWEDVSAERCLPDGKCELATHARIWLDKGKPDDKHVSGKYDVDFGGQHLEGKFLVKYRKEKTAWLCE